MANILMAWQEGGGLGHVLELAPLAKYLLQRGHRVVAVLRDLSRAYRFFGPNVVLFQAPFRTRSVLDRIQPPFTFAHLLHNIGFSDEGELAATTSAWRNIYRAVCPDLIIFDHSPTALLASRGFSARRVLIGSGFCVPPDIFPMPNLRSWGPEDPQQLVRDEEKVLERINRLLRVRELPVLQRIGQLYSEVDEIFLMTLRELDHYPQRAEAEYYGAWPAPGGQKPKWPAGRGKRIFAYLKNFPALPKLLEHLSKLGHPTIVCGDGIPAALQTRMSTETMRFESQPVDLNRVGDECDLAILNAGHNATIALLLRGRPLLLLPIYLEQGICARALKRLGLGLDASCKNETHVVERVDAMLATDQFSIAARRFAAHYADFDVQGQIAKMHQRLDSLLAETPSCGRVGMP